MSTSPARSTFQPSQEDKERLESLFQRCYQYVGRNINSIEQEYGRPAFESLKANFKTRPISTVFACTFAAYSILPILLFTGAATTMVLFTVIFGFVLMFVVMISSVFLLASFLLGALLMVAFLAALSSVSFFGLYALLRLVTHLRTSGFAGVGPWVYEMSAVLKREPQAEKTKEPAPAHLEEVREDSSEHSDISVVSHPIKQEGPPDQ